MRDNFVLLLARYIFKKLMNLIGFNSVFSVFGKSIFPTRKGYLIIYIQMSFGENPYTGLTDILAERVVI